MIRLILFKASQGVIILLVVEYGRQIALMRSFLLIILRIIFPVDSEIVLISFCLYTTVSLVTLPYRDFCIWSFVLREYADLRPIVFTAPVNNLTNLYGMNAFICC